ncbi:hypothetical protein DIS24_g2680 [Lasiodiplodia hormozganensis]|uniref:ATP-dependent RNA helicase DHX8 n=1 Tax=Lasiodiplodia hormozganensis TaxID=869390 RepID=A0AA39Z187_9PEZI|nr:hypothetical protein DIS24_g2680 [Lasiodiplodia hormozganensis]
MDCTPPLRQIRAVYDDKTITVYQAYSPVIADAAVATQHLATSSAFKPRRMTWIKPSWCWMMYRSGYSFKDAGQRRVLALRVTHEGFIELLRRAVLTHGGGGEKVERVEEVAGDVKVQWDPERSPRLERLGWRSIQVGISGDLVVEWANEWIVDIEDVTAKAVRLKEVLDQEPGVGDEELRRRGLIPEEKPYELPADVAAVLGMVDNDA